MTNEIPAPEGADLRAAAQKALDMLAGAHWGKVPYMDGLVYEHASQVAETLRAALAAQPAQEQRSQFCPICEARGRADASPAEAHGLDELRRDLIADTREVFYASGSETPQSVRDVIEYVDSWLQVQVGRAADSAKTKHATKCLEGMLEDDEGARYSCTCGAKKPPTRGQLFTALNEIAQLVGDCEEWAITEDPQVVVSMVKDYMAGVALANVQPKGTPKPCLVSGDCKHGAWCSDVYCQERCQFVKGTDALDALAELCDMATGGWDLPPSAVCRIGALARKARAAIQAPAVAHRLKADDVQWIVNDIAELGVMIHGQAFFLYKGHSLVYEDATHDETGEPMRYRPVFKREFGECAHPINYADLTRIGTVSLDDSDEWRELPPAHPPVQGSEP